MAWIMPDTILFGNMWSVASKKNTKIVDKLSVVVNYLVVRMSE